MPNLRHSCEPLARGTESLLETMVFRRRRNVCDDEQARMSEGSEFQTEGAVTLKQREAKVVHDTRKSEEPTTDWCWRSVKSVQEYGN